MKKIKASDIMSREIVSLVPGSTVHEAAVLMRKNNIGVLPVVSAGALKGVVTDRDIILRCIADGEDPNQTKAQDVMTTNVAYLTPERSVRDVLSLMAAEQVHRVPVVEDGILQGMVSFSDVARCISGSEEEAAMAQTIEEISQTPHWQVYGDQKLREKREREGHE